MGKLTCFHILTLFVGFIYNTGNILYRKFIDMTTVPIKQCNVWNLGYGVQLFIHSFRVRDTFFSVFAELIFGKMCVFSRFKIYLVLISSNFL